MNSMNHPVNKSTLEAECRALWRAAYAARVANGCEWSEAAAKAGDLAVEQYRERYKPKAAKDTV